VHDLVATSAESIAEIRRTDRRRRALANRAVIRYSDELAKANRALRKFLYQNVYYHPRVAEVNRRACEMLRRVFEAYLADPDKLARARRDESKKRIASHSLRLIAGMTDRYVMEEYTRLPARNQLAPQGANTVSRDAPKPMRRRCRSRRVNI